MPRPLTFRLHSPGLMQSTSTPVVSSLYRLPSATAMFVLVLQLLERSLAAAEFRILGALGDDELSTAVRALVPLTSHCCHVDIPSTGVAAPCESHVESAVRGTLRSEEHTSELQSLMRNSF